VIRRSRAFERLRRTFFPASSLDRLADTLPTYRRELDFLIHSTNATQHRWAVDAKALLEDAEHAVSDRNADRAWRSFHAVQRLELYGLLELGPEAFRARAASLRAECAQKLRSWRKSHAEDLFRAARDHDGKVTDAEFAAAREASLLLDVHFGNEALKQRASRSQAIVLEALMLLAIAAWMVLAFQRPLDPEALARFNDRPLMLSVLAFGLLGAGFSALISLGTQSAAQTIPEQAFTYRITLARQVVGVVSALATALLLTSGFITIGKFEPTVALVLVGAFAAGFSERLVLRALERFAGPVDSRKTPDADARKR
jgi:hypothetical protein